MTSSSENLYNGEIPPNTPLKAKTTKERRLALMLIIGAVTLGILVAFFFIKTKPKAKKKAPVTLTTSVEVISLNKKNINIVIETYGVLAPAKEISLTPQISGIIKSINSNFVPGGTFKKGETIAVIDSFDYKVNLKQKEAIFETARAELELEEGKQGVAKKEWSILQTLSGREATQKEKSIALRAPQLKKTKANFNSAKAGLEKAEKDLKRTKIKAPFDAIIKTKNIDVGSYVSMQSVIAGIIGTYEYWTILTLPYDRLKWIDLKKSQIFLKKGDSKIEYKAKILKLLPNLESNGLTAQLLVTIENPTKLSKKNPLLIGSYMKARIIGKKIKNVFKVPLKALDDRDRLFIYSYKKLKIKTPKILWKDEKFAYITSGIKKGEELIITKIATPIQDMALIKE